jgi:hypothetical protein
MTIMSYKLEARGPWALKYLRFCFGTRVALDKGVERTTNKRNERRHKMKKLIVICILSPLVLIGCDGVGYESATPECGGAYDAGYDDAVADTPVKVVEVEVEAENPEVDQYINDLERENSDLQAVITGLWNNLHQERDTVNMLNADLVECNRR